ncbi:MAG: pantoate--beta-alanine ligase [Acidimicrobiia bacterium]|nr:pantoate--beta-alanine ligase [Acidimicrobiia bacterium]
MIEHVETFAGTRDLQRARGGSIGLVPTLGFLHEGHSALIQRARSECDVVTVSVFVNPLQFGEGEDLDRYPRDIERDSTIAAAAGADLVFAPALAEMFPEAPVTTVSLEALTDTLTGKSRPGHFAGVATIVTKLFAGLQPDRAYFGRKDAQQLAVVTRLASDLSFPVRVVGCPIIREADGLAMSSRNTYLNDLERRAATSLSRGLMAAADAVERGTLDAETLEAIAYDAMSSEHLVEPEYAELHDAHSVVHLNTVDRDSFLAVAGRLGETRLIDNVHFDVTDEGIVIDRGIRSQQTESGQS